MKIKTAVFLLLVSVILFFLAADAYSSIALLFACLICFFMLLCTLWKRKNKKGFLIVLSCFIFFLFIIFILPAL
ncbi:MAG TPA: hypothetical protein DE060_03830 [Lentisphaeria bacterium]|nr:hypothetical protein [Lentisphaeria bacterium]HCG48322.1 hypothetical protein [Lentisphaeria bacterium]